jgi:hypothetical protein
MSSSDKSVEFDIFLYAQPEGRGEGWLRKGTKNQVRTVQPPGPFVNGRLSTHHGLGSSIVGAQVLLNVGY